jgi:hypothetical protein
MVTTWEYNDLIDAIVERMIGVLGRERALKYAGVPITAQDRFAGKASKQDLETLCKNYIRVSGNVGRALIQHTVRLRLNGRNVELPDSVR